MTQRESFDKRDVAACILFSREKDLISLLGTRMNPPESSALHESVSSRTSQSQVGIVNALVAPCNKPP